MRAGLTVGYEDRCVRFGTDENVMVGVWRDPPNRQRAAALRTTLARLRAKHAVVAQLHVIHAGDTSPLSLSLEGRDELIGSLRENRPEGTLVAIAIEGSSFFVAAWRSILSAITLVVRPKYPLKLFATRAEAADWLSARLASARTPAALLEHVRALEAGLLPP